MAEWTDFLQGFAAFLGALGAVLIASHSKKKADGEPPVDRPPSPHEIRELLRAIMALLQKHHELSHEDVQDIKKTIDRIEQSNRLQEEMARFRREIGR